MNCAAELLRGDMWGIADHLADVDCLAWGQTGRMGNASCSLPLLNILLVESAEVVECCSLAWPLKDVAHVFARMLQH